MWIGLFFGILCLGVQFRQILTDGSDRVLPSELSSNLAERVDVYRKKITQCLKLGGYTKCVPYSVEVLLLYFQAEHFYNESARTELWILLGTVIRMAQRMGYHQDSSNFPLISQFHAEMRRRVWAVIFQFDSTASSTYGLPRLIREATSNTTEPRNLMDTEFDEDSTELPPPRADLSATQVPHLVAKNRLYSVYGLITDMTSSLVPYPYNEVMRLDEILQKTYNSIPPGLHMRSLSLSTMDDRSLIIRRLLITLLFHKARCTLHRKYMIQGRTNSRYVYSRTQCIEASLQILEYQSMLNQAIAPGGILYLQRQKISQIVRQEFLLATTILCVDLDHDIKLEFTKSQWNTSKVPTSERIIRALQESYLIWLGTSEVSQESKRACKALRIVLGKAGRLEPLTLATPTGILVDKSGQTPILTFAMASPASKAALSNNGSDSSVNLSRNPQRERNQLDSEQSTDQYQFVGHIETLFSYNTNKYRRIGIRMIKHNY
jgi:hypothetical protein